jgi:hypothetical protein
MISRPMARRSPRGVTLVQVVIVVSLLAMAVAGMTWALQGELGSLFGEADNTLNGTQKTEAADDQTQRPVTGRSGEHDPNAFQHSMEQSAQESTQAAAKAKGTP